MPIAARSSSRPGPRPRLSREAIVDCALRLMDREGPEALSFRAVARELGIAAGALSNYFPNLAALQDHVAAKVMSGVRPIALRRHANARKELLRFGMNLMETAHAHPYLVNIYGPESVAVITRLMARSMKALLQAGVDGERALAAFSIVTSLGHAWGIRDAIPRSAETNARGAEVFQEEFGGVFPAMPTIAGMTPANIYRKWFTLCIEGLLP